MQHMGFPDGSRIKNLPANARDVYSIPGLGRYPGEGHGNPLQYFCLENPMERGAWWATVYVVAKSWTWLTDWLIHTHTHTDLNRKTRGCHSHHLDCVGSARFLHCNIPISPLPPMLTLKKKKLELICNVALISSLEQSDSDTHTYLFFQVFYPYRLLQNTEKSSLCYTVGPWLVIYFIYSIVYLPTLLPRPWTASQEAVSCWKLWNDLPIRLSHTDRSSKVYLRHVKG